MRINLDTYLLVALTVGLAPIGCSANESGTGDDTANAADIGLDLEAAPDPDTPSDSAPNAEVDYDLPDAALDETSTDGESEDSDGELTDSTPADVPTDEDGAPCSGIQYPQRGCPCDPSQGPQECCIHVAYGLVCSEFFKQWVEFGDCGCDPRCGPTFSLCIAPLPEPEE